MPPEFPYQRRRQLGGCVGIGSVATASTDAFRVLVERCGGAAENRRGVEPIQPPIKSQNVAEAWNYGGNQGISGWATLTVSPRRDYLFKLISKRRTSMNRAGGHEADIQAAQSQAGEQARVPSPHEDQGRPQSSQPSSSSGPGSSRRQDRREVGPEHPDRVERLPRQARIRLGSEIRDLLERGERKRTRNLDVFFAASPASRSRLGLIVPKHGHGIVERNLVKRRLREIGRREVLPRLEEAGREVDVLVRARREAYGAPFGRLQEDLKEVVEDLCSPRS